MENKLDILDLLDLFEEEVEQRSKKESENSDRITIYGEWADYDLEAAISKRKKWKEELKSCGVNLLGKEFCLKGEKIIYSSNYINHMAFLRLIDCYSQKQQDSFFNDIYPKIKSGKKFLSYAIEKSILSYVNNNIRFIKIVLSDFDISYSKKIDIADEYKRYIDFSGMHEFIENTEEMIKNKIVDIIKKRWEKRVSSNPSQVTAIGTGLDGMVKGMAVSELVNYVINKTNDFVQSVGDEMAIKETEKSIKEVIEYFSGSLVGLIKLSSDAIYPFLDKLFRQYGMSEMLDIGEDGAWKDILGFSEYEYKRGIINSKTYFMRLCYLLQEYPMEQDIYKAVLKYDINCSKDIYIIAEYFNMGKNILETIQQYHIERNEKYAYKSVIDVTEDYINRICGALENGFDGYLHTKKILDEREERILHSIEQSNQKVFSLAEVDKLCLLKRSNPAKDSSSAKTIEQHWEAIGKEGAEHIRDAEAEYILLEYYTNLVKEEVDYSNKAEYYIKLEWKKAWAAGNKDLKTEVFVKNKDKLKKERQKNCIESFEKKLKGLKGFFSDENIYKSDFSKFIYTFLLEKLYNGINMEMAKLFWKDIEVFAQKGIIAAIYQVGLRQDDKKKKEEFFLRAASCNYPAAAFSMGNLYSEKNKKNPDIWHEALSERWFELAFMFKNQTMEG